MNINNITYIMNSIQESLEKIDGYMQETEALAAREDLSAEEKEKLDNEIFSKMEKELAIVDQKNLVLASAQKAYAKKQKQKLILGSIGFVLIICLLIYFIGVR